MTTSPRKKAAVKPATGCLIFIYFWYVMLVLTFFPDDHAAHERVSVSLLMFGPMFFWQVAFIVVPVYIYIFNRIYDELRRVDFAFLCAPFLIWLILAFFGRSTSKSVYYEPAIVLILTGAYFLILPLSRRYPAIPRLAISFSLFGLILAGMMTVVCFRSQLDSW